MQYRNLESAGSFFPFCLNKQVFLIGSQSETLTLTNCDNLSPKWQLHALESTSTTIWSVNAFFSLCFSYEVRFAFVSEFSISTDASTLPAELQRLLNTVRELDDRSQCKCFLEILFHFICCLLISIFF